MANENRNYDRGSTNKQRIIPEKKLNDDYYNENIVEEYKHNIDTEINNERTFNSSTLDSFKSYNVVKLKQRDQHVTDTILSKKGKLPVVNNHKNGNGIANNDKNASTFSNTLVMKRATPAVNSSNNNNIKYVDYVAASKSCEPFVRHVLNNAYYMYIICKSEGKQFKIFYANLVPSVINEYSDRYSYIDECVLIASFDKFKFMISYKLILEMAIPISQPVNFTETLLNDRNIKCYFSEVLDSLSLSVLIHVFKLDILYSKSMIGLLMSAIGEEKSAQLYNHVNSIINDTNIINLPLVTTRNEEPSEVLFVNNKPTFKYVDNIIKYSENMYYPLYNESLRDMSREEKVRFITNTLKFWRIKKHERGTFAKDQENYFPYTYSRIVSVLFERERSQTKLYKLRIDEGNALMIESFLCKCADLPQLNCFILIKTKNNDRITIIKKGTAFIWICNRQKDIAILDIINDYKKYKHYVFSLNRDTRKELTVKHNGVIKLISYYTSEFLTMEEVKWFAENLLDCDYRSLKFEN